MKFLPSQQARLGIAAIAIALCLGVGRDLTAAGGGDPMMPGGGDAIGSLPYSTPLSPPSGFASEPVKPSIVFEGPSVAAIQAVVVDAVGTGYAELFQLPEGGVRVELQGKVSVLLDRNRLAGSGVKYALDVSQGFSGGLLILTGGARSSSQWLPAQGDLALPLVELAASGLLDEDVLRMHSISVAGKHHMLEMACSGGILRLLSRD